MSFAAAFRSLPLDQWYQRSLAATPSDVQAAVARVKAGGRGAGTLSEDDFAVLVSPAAAAELESLAVQAQNMTRQRFGKVIRFFAPLYLSNECINSCSYCGFSRENPILRVTLTVEDVAREAKALSEQGFRNLLLVAGEHPKFVSRDYLVACIQATRGSFPSVSLEVGPMEVGDYRPCAEAGAEGLVVYQETYDRDVYARMHTFGPKKDFDWRLETPERAYSAGFRRLGIGALYGLADWRREVLCVAAHARHLLKHCWKSQVTISLPRLRPCAGEFQPLTVMSDRDLAQALCAFRLFLPDVGLVLSTREPPRLRDGLFPLGVTLISAGSHTEPGGYTGAGRETLHRTERGRIKALAEGASEWATVSSAGSGATEQFTIADPRSPAEVADVVRRLGYEPVWKDWDQALGAGNDDEREIVHG